LENIREPTKTKPEGRYGSAFEAAVSVAAKLSAPAAAMAPASPDVAASIALNPAATLEQRRAALRPALDSGHLKTSDVLAILTARGRTPVPARQDGRPRATASSGSAGSGPRRLRQRRSQTRRPRRGLRRRAQGRDADGHAPRSHRAGRRNQGAPENRRNATIC